jgi:hypothetical protein
LLPGSEPPRLSEINEHPVRGGHDANFIPLGPQSVPLVGTEIVSVVIVSDEGTDVGPGEAILDDIISTIWSRRPRHDHVEGPACFEVSARGSPSDVGAGDS